MLSFTTLILDKNNLKSNFFKSLKSNCNHLFSRIVTVKNTSGKKVPLHSIHAHPMNDHQFCVSGKDEYVRVYDRRLLSPFGPPVIKYCPNHLVSSLDIGISFF